MTEKFEIQTMKDCILDVWKGKLSYPLNRKGLEELEKIIDYYEEENQQLRKQLQQRDEVIEKASQLLEFYLIGNLKYNQESQVAFNKLLDVLNIKESE